jgi:hypothetical protein
MPGPIDVWNDFLIALLRRHAFTDFTWSWPGAKMWYSSYRFAWRIIDSSVISFPDIKMIVKFLSTMQLYWTPWQKMHPSSQKLLEAWNPRC